jgi:hypothetical protein
MARKTMIGLAAFASVMAVSTVNASAAEKYAPLYKGRSIDGMYQVKGPSDVTPIGNPTQTCKLYGSPRAAAYGCGGIRPYVSSLKPPVQIAGWPTAWKGMAQDIEGEYPHLTSLRSAYGYAPAYAKHRVRGAHGYAPAYAKHRARGAYGFASFGPTPGGNKAPYGPIVIGDRVFAGPPQFVVLYRKTNRPGEQLRQTAITQLPTIP